MAVCIAYPDCGAKHLIRGLRPFHANTTVDGVGTWGLFKFFVCFGDFYTHVLFLFLWLSSTNISVND